MKIISEGNIEKVFETIIFNCPICGCIFKADNREYKKQFDQREAQTRIIVKCPFCNKKFSIDEKKVEKI